MLHFVWQATSIGKIDMLKSFIKYIFYIDYSAHLNNKTKMISTVHNELVSNLVVLIKQIQPIQDLCQMNRLYKNCWFCLEITLKSLCLYSIQFKQLNNNKSDEPLFDCEFYDSLRSLYELLVESTIKWCPLLLKIPSLLIRIKAVIGVLQSWFQFIFVIKFSL